jgi:peptide/nickel transport system permease protein
MAAYIVRRLWQMIPTLAGVILLVFFLFKWFGGDPAEILAGQNASAEQVQLIKDGLGLNEPIWYQLWLFVKSVFTFDWGQSWTTKEPVTNILTTRIGPTLTVMVPILVIDVILAIPLAMWVAYRRDSIADRSIMILTTLALSVSFLVYVIMGQYWFGFKLGWFPVQGWSDSFWRNISYFAPLPILLAVFVSLAPQTRLYRTFFLDEMRQDYVRTARAKGVSESKVLFTHVLRNALIPVMTNIGVQLPGVFVGSFLIEYFFSIPGIGRELIQAVNGSDFPVIKALTVYLAMITMIINLLVDLAYRAVDPRVVLK